MIFKILIIINYTSIIDQYINYYRLLHRPVVDSNAWGLPILEPDRGIVQRSQLSLYAAEKKRPIQIEPYFVAHSFFTIVQFIFFGIWILLLAQFSFGRSLLLKYPEFFTMGHLSRQGPSEEKMANGKFKMVFYGRGWSKDAKLTDEPNKTVVTQISTTLTTYGVTAVALLCSTVTILKETDKLLGSGGVLSTGAAFYHTNLIKELQKNGFNFDVISSD